MARWPKSYFHVIYVFVIPRAFPTSIVPPVLGGFLFHASVYSAYLRRTGGEKC